ncbi:carbonic anhydrase [Candidatus Margulisiibacteriota bacterium]
MSNSFATAINCMDGRVQTPVADYLKGKYNVQYVDMITEPGPNKILAEGSDENTVNSIIARVKISVEKHGSKVIAVAGHHDCAGNPAKKEIQLDNIKRAVDIVSSWGFKAEVIGLWVDESREVAQVS